MRGDERGREGATLANARHRCRRRSHALKSHVLAGWPWTNDVDTTPTRQSIASRARIAGSICSTAARPSAIAGSAR
jgi:hypothetical protein